MSVVVSSAWIAACTNCLWEVQGSAGKPREPDWTLAAALLPQTLGAKLDALTVDLMRKEVDREAS